MVSVCAVHFYAIIPTHKQSTDCYKYGIMGNGCNGCATAAITRLGLSVCVCVLAALYRVCLVLSGRYACREWYGTTVVLISLGSVADSLVFKLCGIQIIRLQQIRVVFRFQKQSHECGFLFFGGDAELYDGKASESLMGSVLGVDLELGCAQLAFVMVIVQKKRFEQHGVMGSVLEIYHGEC